MKRILVLALVLIATGCKDPKVILTWQGGVLGTAAIVIGLVMLIFQAGQSFKKYRNRNKL